MSGLLELPGKLARKLRSRSPSPSRDPTPTPKQASGGKAEAVVKARWVKDFSAEQFAELLRKQCSEFIGDTPNILNPQVDLNHKGMTDESMARLAEGMLDLFLGSSGDERGDGDNDKDDCPPTLMGLSLNGNPFGGDGLGALAEVLSRLPRCRETLKRLSIFDNPKVTTLAPLAAAGVLEGLKELQADGCSLSDQGDEGVLPPDLCANLPALEVLSFPPGNKNFASVTLTAEALCALPAKCKVMLHGSRVKVAPPSSEDGETGPWNNWGCVQLPTAMGEEFGAVSVSDAKTVAEICAFAGVQRLTLVKPAHA